MRFIQGVWVRDAVLLYIVALVAHLVAQYIVRSYADGGYLWNSDAVTYWRLAENLRDSGVLTIDLSWGPMAFRTPLYPAFLAIATFGASGLGFAVAVQGLFAAVNVSLLYVLARLYTHRITAVGIALLYLLDIQRLFTATQAMSETVFLSFFLFGLLAWQLARVRYEHWITPALAGLLFGLATLVRPIGWPAAVIIAVLWLVESVYQKHFSRGRGAVVFFFCCLCVVAPWIMRNGVRFGEYAISPLLGINLYLTNAVVLQEAQSITGPGNTGALGGWMQKAIDDLGVSVNMNASDWVYTSTQFMEFAYEPYFRESAFALVSNDPVTYLGVHLRRVIPFLLDGGLSRVTAVVLGDPPDWWPGLYYPFLFWLARLWWGVIWTIVVYGAFRTRLFRGPPQSIFLFFVLFLGLHLFVAAMNRDAPRMRMPIDPLTFLFLGISVERLWSRFQNWQSI